MGRAANPSVAFIADICFTPKFSAPDSRPIEVIALYRATKLTLK